MTTQSSDSIISKLINLDQDSKQLLQSLESFSSGLDNLTFLTEDFIKISNHVKITFNLYNEILKEIDVNK